MLPVQRDEAVADQHTGSAGSVIIIETVNPDGAVRITVRHAEITGRWKLLRRLQQEDIAMFSARVSLGSLRAVAPLTRSRGMHIDFRRPAIW